MLLELFPIKHLSFTFHHCPVLQVYADDVLTKEEQIGLLFKAKQMCEDNIKSKTKIPGEYVTYPVIWLFGATISQSHIFVC